METNYYALIGDIVNSKDIDDRKFVQDELDDILKKINDEYSPVIVSKFTITLGDEFQVLLNEKADLMMMMMMIENALYPIKIRFAIGYGTITTNINPLMSIGADGPAYYSAREAMDYLKANNQKKMTSSKNVWFCTMDNEFNKTIDLINIVLSMLNVIKSKWKKEQYEIVYQMNFCENQTVLAEKLNLKLGTINKRLNSASYYTYKDSIETLKSAFENVGEIDV